MNTITSLIGNGEPTTTDKTIIGAINEINAQVGNTVTAASVTYDNTTSGMTADDVQEAIDENAADIATLNASLAKKISVPDYANLDFTGRQNVQSIDYTATSKCFYVLSLGATQPANSYMSITIANALNITMNPNYPFVYTGYLDAGDTIKSSYNYQNLTVNLGICPLK